MSDTSDVTDEAEALIQELLDAGFAYESNGRLAGLAGQEEPAADEEDDAAEDLEESDLEETSSVSVPEEESGEGTAEPSRLELRGTPLTEYEADNLLRLRSVLIEHPELAGEIEDRIAGRIPPPAAGAPPAEEPASSVTPPAETKLPDFIDPDDEQSVRLWGEIQEIRGRDDATRQAVTQAIESADRARVNGEVAQAVDRFKVQHPDLTDVEIEAIRNYTSANVNIPGVMANFPLDPVTGLVKALEIGSLSEPSTRDRVLHTQRATREAEDQTRKSDLSKLSGTSGSSSTRARAPKETKPQSWRDVATRLARELEESLGSS
jgi:hypothetical protein